MWLALFLGLLQLLLLETETNSFQEIFLKINRFCKFVVATSRI